MKPRILYVTAFLPHGPSSGSQLRTLHVARALRQVGDVSLLIVGGQDAGQAAVQATSEEFQIESVAGMERAPALSLSRRVRDVFNPRRMNLHGFIADGPARHKLERKLKDFDLVWLHQLYAPNAFGRWHWPRSVMDIDDIPSTFERTIWRNGAGVRERLKARWKMRACRARERLLAERFDVLAVCSEADRAHLSCGAPVHVIPNGFERPRTQLPRRPADPPRIGFIGLMAYPPNFEGVQWFVRKCWPGIKRQLPNARLRLVGKGSEGLFKCEGADIDGLGWFEDPAEEIASWSLMIVPLHTGAGTRIKIAEAFSRRCPVVSTRLGAFGYDVTDGREMRLADSADEFGGACLDLIKRPSEAAAMAGRAWNRFLNEWTWEAIAPKIWAAAEDCLKRNQPASRATIMSFAPMPAD